MKKNYKTPITEEYPLYLSAAVCSGGLGGTPSQPSTTEPTPMNPAPKKVF